MMETHRPHTVLVSIIFAGAHAGAIRPVMTNKIWFALALALAGCGEQRPPAPTAEQNDQLNEAEEMLNEEAGNESP